MRLTLSSLAAAILLSGCALSYRPDVVQGNYLTAETLSQVEVGMTREQVVFVLGNPMAGSPFHANRWDYIYHLDRHRGDDERAYVVIWFENDRVARIDTRQAPPR